MLFSKKRDFAFFVLSFLLALSISAPAFAVSSTVIQTQDGPAPRVAISTSVEPSTAADSDVTKLKAEVIQLKQKQAEQEKKIAWLESQVALLLKSLKPATGSTGSSSGSSVAQADDSTSLFSDDFSGGFPGANWVYEAGSNPQVDAGTGNPEPSLKILPVLKTIEEYDAASRSAVPVMGWRIIPSVSLKTAVNPFSTSNGLDVSVDFTLPPSRRASFTFEMYNQNTQRRLAYVYVDKDSKSLSYNLLSSKERSDAVSATAFFDGKFHTFNFIVDADGNAKWLKDGVVQMSRSGFEKGDYLVHIATGDDVVPVDNYGRVIADRLQYNDSQIFRVDNVRVKSLNLKPKATSTSTSTTTTSGTTVKTTGPGKLSVSDDSGGYLYIGSSYIGQGAAVISLNPGTYTLYATSASTGNVCWQKSVVISSGKTTTAKISGKYCR